MRTYLSVSVREQGQSIVVEVDGELDLGSCRQFEQAIEHVLPGRGELLVIDLSKLSFMDMAGLRALMNVQDHAERGGGQMMLANARDAVRRVLRLANVNGMFTILENDV